MTRITLSHILLIAASAILFVSVASADTVLTRVSGAVEIGRGEPAVWSTAKRGDVLASNDRVRTGADGRAEIKMGAGTLRVHENSMLRLPPATANTDQIDLEQGKSLFDVLRRTGRRFEVRTPTVVVSVKGTRFSVYAGTDVGEVIVYRGTVGVRELGADDKMETLVRKGFLAIGGIGIPIELDVSADADPWQAWERNDRAHEEERPTPNRKGEMGRAKAALHRATEADVIVKAAERRPEIAQRLAEMQQEQRERALREAKRTRNSDPDMQASGPAAPSMGDAMPGAARRLMLQQNPENQGPGIRADETSRRALNSRQLIEAERINTELNLEATSSFDAFVGLSQPVPGSGSFDFAAVYEQSPESLLLVRSSLDEVVASYQDGTFVPTSPADLITQIERQLISKGMTASGASATVQTLLGN